MIKNFCLGDNEKKLNKIAANSKKNTIFALAKFAPAGERVATLLAVNALTGKSIKNIT